MEIVSLLGSSAYRVLSLNDDPPDLIERLQSLGATDRERFNQLWGICRRLNFIDHLRVAYPISISLMHLPRFRFDLDRLTAYLAATCIEICVSARSYQTYDIWLNKKLKEHTENSVQNLLSPIASATEIAKLKKEMTSFVVQTNQLYLSEMGLARAFRGFFTDEHMSPWLQDWLVNTYYILQNEFWSEDGIAELGNRRWVKKEREERCRQIANYLYGQVRNKHTHTARHYPHHEGESSYREHVVISGTDYGFVRLPKDGDQGNIAIGLKLNYPESEVIRLLVVAHLRRNFLHIQDEAPLIEQYWANAEQRANFYRFAREVKENFATIKLWCSAHLYVPVLQYNQASPLVPLNNEAAKSLLAGSNNEASLLGMGELPKYVELVEKVNVRIERYKKRFAGKSFLFADVGKFLPRLVRSTDLRELFRVANTLQQFTIQETDWDSDGMVDARS